MPVGVLNSNWAAALQNKTTTDEMRWACLKGLAFNHIFIQLPAMMLFHPAAEMLGMQMHAPFPKWYVNARLSMAAHARAA